MEGVRRKSVGGGSSSKKQAKSRRASTSGNASDARQPGLTQSEVLERIAALSQLLSPEIREKASSIMKMNVEDSDGATSLHKSGKDKGRVSNASISVGKRRSSGSRQNSEMSKEEEEEAAKDPCGRSAKSISLKFLSKTEVCTYDGGQIHMNKDGKKFMKTAMEICKIHCFDIHKKWPELKKWQKDNIIRELKQRYGSGFSRRWVLKKLSRKWNHYRYNLRQDVREDSRMEKPDEVTEESWELFKEDSKNVYENKKKAAAARTKAQSTGSGGDDGIKAQFFNYYCGYPTDMELLEIKNAGGFRLWLMTQKCSDIRYDAKDYAGKGATKCVFKPKSILEKDDKADNDVQDEDNAPSIELEDDLDIIGLDEEVAIKEKDVQSGSNGSSSSSSGSSSSSSIRSASDSDTSDESSDEDTGAHRTSPTPSPRKTNCRDIAKGIYKRRGLTEPPTPVHLRKL